MKTLIKIMMLLMFLMMAGCGADCMNNSGPRAGQCNHYDNISYCAEVSPYHQSCTVPKK
jgi:hypothetical protein